jgi:predicted transposase/invertase (TIGR01784 family)
MEQITSSINYRPELNVFTIVVLTQGDKHKVDMSSIDFDPKDRHGKALGEIRHKILYLCPKYVSEETPEPYWEWLRAIDDSFDEQVEETLYQKTAIQTIFKQIKKDLITPQEYARMKDEYSEEQWRKEQDEKQYKEGKRDTAKKMLEKGMDISLVTEMTGFSTEELQKLA